MRRSIPELPQARLDRFAAEYQLSEEDASLLTSTREQADYFEETARISANPRTAANWIMGDLAYALKNSGTDIDRCPVSPAILAGLLSIIDSGRISGKIAKTVFEEMFRSGDEASAVVQRLGLAQISDEASLVTIIEKVKTANPKQLADYRSGKDKLLAYFVGQVMKETRGQANPQLLNDLLRRSLRE
jgi:aspartyl-tRNA(Asn)/glutamyl-tRNA(Gln) amidotransferase subunit B